LLHLLEVRDRRVVATSDPVEGESAAMPLDTQGRWRSRAAQKPLAGFFQRYQGVVVQRPHTSLSVASIAM
jgi:hypothetical protein